MRNGSARTRASGLSFRIPPPLLRGSAGSLPAPRPPTAIALTARTCSAPWASAWTDGSAPRTSRRTNPTRGSGERPPSACTSPPAAAGGTCPPTPTTTCARPRISASPGSSSNGPTAARARRTTSFPISPPSRIWWKATEHARNLRAGAADDLVRVERHELARANEPATIDDDVAHVGLARRVDQRRVRVWPGRRGGRGGGGPTPHPPAPPPFPASAPPSPLPAPGRAPPPAPPPPPPPPPGLA